MYNVLWIELKREHFALNWNCSLSNLKKIHFAKSKVESALHRIVLHCAKEPAVHWGSSISIAYCDLWTVFNCELWTAYCAQESVHWGSAMSIPPPPAACTNPLRHLYPAHFSQILFAQCDILHTFHCKERYPAYFSLHRVISYLYLADFSQIKKF